MTKKLLSVWLSVCMVLTLLPVSAMAEEANAPIRASREIIAFAPLVQTEITTMTGMSIQDLELPETLTATVRIAAIDGEIPVQDSGSPYEDTVTRNSAVATTSSAIEVNVSESRDSGEAADPEWEETTQDIPATWTSQPEYDMDTEGEYVFTPVIEGYTVSAVLPEITVMVGEMPPITAARTLLGTSESMTVSTEQELLDAILNVAGGGTIILGDAVSLNATVTINSGNNKSVTINLNGKTLNSNSLIAIKHEGSGTLTIDDTGEGEIRSSCDSGTITLEGGSLVVKNGTVLNTKAGSGRSIENLGTGNVSVIGGKLIAPFGIYNSSSGSINMTGGIVESTSLHGILNYSTSTGNVDVSGGTVKNSGSGTAICNFSSGEITISNKATITSACIDSNWGTITLYNTPTADTALVIVGGTIENTAENGIAISNKSGGKISVRAGTASVKGKGIAMAMSRDNQLLLEEDVVVKASKNYDGIDASRVEAETLNTIAILDYKYLKFEQTINSAVATIGDTGYYFTLQDAVNAVGANETIVLKKDIIEKITIENDYSFALNLNGKTLDGGGNSAIIHAGSGTLTITNPKASESGKVTCASYDGGTIWLTGGSDSDIILNITGGRIENTAEGGTAIYNDDSGRIAVLSGVAIVRGKGMAMNTAPSIYMGGRVTASTSYEGSPTSKYWKANITDYKFLYFDQNIAAQIGETSYIFLQEAFDSVGEGQTIKLLNDISLTNNVTIPNGNSKNFILDLNGKTLDCWLTAILHEGSGTLTITDTGAGGKISSGQYQPIWLEGGSLVVAGGTVENRIPGMAAITNISSGSVSVTGGTIRSKHHTIINESSGSVSVTGGTVESIENSAIYNGRTGTGKILIGGTATVTSANTSTSSGTIYQDVNTEKNTVIEITGGTIENTSTSGYAIHTNSKGKISVTSGTSVIKSGGTAMNKAPDLSRYSRVQVTASANYDGSLPVSNYENGNIGNYKYLKFFNNDVAQISQTRYATLQDAVNSVSANNQTIQLIKDSIENINILGTNDYSFILDLNGKVLNGRSGGDTTVMHLGSGTLTITDTSRDRGGIVTSSYAGISTGTIHLRGGSIVVNEGTVKSTLEPYGIAIKNSSAGSVSVNGGTVQADYIAIYNDSASTVSISGGTVSTTGTNGVGIYSKETSKISIPSGSSVIMGKGNAMNIAPDLTGYANVKVTASTSYNGSSPVNYQEEDISGYRYLAFSPRSLVTQLDLTSKLTAPVTGGSQVVEITEGDQYAGTVTWSGYSAKFLGGTAYTANVTLTAKTGYTFDGLAANSFSFVDATVAHAEGSGNTLSVNITFPNTAAKVLESIAVTTEPTKTTYKYGESFNPAGMVVKATYDDGTADVNFTDYTVDKTDALTMSDTLVTLTANGTSITTTQAITVTRKTPNTGDLVYDLTAVDYDGIKKPVSVVAALGKTLGAITVKYDGSTTEPVNAGTYAITVDIAENAEYNAAPGLSLGSYAINQIAYTGTKTVPASILTSGQAGAIVTLPDLPAGASYGTPTAGGAIVMTGMSITGTILTYTAPLSTAGQTGTMTIPVTGATNYNNYSIVVTVTYTAKTPQVISYAGAVANKTYGDAKFINPLTQTTVNGTITYTSDDTSVATVNSSTGEVTIVAVGDGSATITATVAETGIHAQATASYTVTIAKKALTLKADDKSMTKGDELLAFTYTVTGLVNSDAVTSAPTMSTTTDGTAVGTFDITMTGGAVANAASYDITYTKGTLTVAERLFTAMVTNGTGGGSYAESATVTITAHDKSGHTFTSWSGADVTFADATAKSTTFTMPAKAVTVTAKYRQNSSGGDSGGSGGSGSGGGSSSNDNSNPVIVTPPALDKPNSPTQGEIKVPGTVDSNGNVTVNITDKTVTDAFDKAFADAKQNGNQQNGITVMLHVDTGSKTGSNVTVNLPKTVQDTIIEKKIVSTIVVVDNPDIRIGMDLATVQEINKQAKSDINITATRANSGTLTEDAKKAIGNRPVFDLKVNYGSGQQVQSFGTGSVSVTIPYTLGANEKAGNVQAVYMDANGKVHWLVNSVYDSVEQVLRFATSHFSTYGIGYKQTNTVFTDIAGHWAKEDIEFVVSRGLFSGTSTTTFSPNTAMTRGMFVTALGRLANADVSGYTKSSFTDVKSDAYYMGYIEWASKNSIVNGVGNNKFAPDQSITREQMVVIMQNYAKDEVKQMQMAGVISGKNGNLFDSQDIANRAEASAVLCHLVELANSRD